MQRRHSVRKNVCTINIREYYCFFPHEQQCVRRCVSRVCAHARVCVCVYVSVCVLCMSVCVSVYRVCICECVSVHVYLYVFCA